MPCRAVAIWFQALFTPRLGVLFSFPSRYIVRYRSWDVFRIGSRCLPASRPISNGRYSGDVTSTLLGAHLRGFNPLRRWHSSQTSTHSHEELYVSCPPTTPHSLHIAMGGSVCPVPLSFAITHGIACCFLFLRLLRCFSSAGSRSHGGAVPLLSGDWEVPFGDPGFQGCMLLARAYRSLPRPSSAPKPSHPPDGMITVGFPYDGSKLVGFPAKTLYWLAPNKG